jgi:type IV secretory pathway component VirB8
MRAQVPGQMELDYARTLLGVRLAEFRAARQQRDRGASAIELAIITAIIVGLAAIVLIVITHIVQTRANQINQNNGQIP